MEILSCQVAGLSCKGKGPTKAVKAEAVISQRESADAGGGPKDVKVGRWIEGRKGSRSGYSFRKCSAERSESSGTC